MANRASIAAVLVTLACATLCAAHGDHGHGHGDHVCLGEALHEDPMRIVPQKYADAHPHLNKRRELLTASNSAPIRITTVNVGLEPATNSFDKSVEDRLMPAAVEFFQRHLRVSPVVGPLNLLTTTCRFGNEAPGQTPAIPASVFSGVPNSDLVIIVTAEQWGACNIGNVLAYAGACGQFDSLDRVRSSGAVPAAASCLSSVSPCHVCIVILRGPRSPLSPASTSARCLRLRHGMSRWPRLCTSSCTRSDSPPTGTAAVRKCALLRPHPQRRGPASDSHCCRPVADSRTSVTPLETRSCLVTVRACQWMATRRCRAVAAPSRRSCPAPPS